jgi:sporulation protein YqfC
VVFVEDILAKFKLDKGQFLSHKVILSGGLSVYIEGVLGIAALSLTEIGVRLKDKKITIIGENLKITNYQKDTILIEGQIKGVSYAD